jgi:hypothetical protein
LVGFGFPCDFIRFGDASASGRFRRIWMPTRKRECDL